VHDRAGRLVGGTRNGHVLRFDGVPPACVSVPMAPLRLLRPAAEGELAMVVISGAGLVPLAQGERDQIEVYRRSQRTGADGHRLYLLEAVR
jgi:hypothetical protein